MAYIYKIINDINNKIYIGKTYRTIEKRFQEHCREYKTKRGESRPLYKAMKKYGIEHFHIELIEETSNPEEREKYWIEYYGSFKYGYNATRGGDGKPYINYELVIKTYKILQSIRKTAQVLKIDTKTISKILQNNNIEIYHNNEILRKPVAKIDKKTGEILKIYSSITEAERENGNTRHIADVCRGSRKSCKGFFWKYI